MSGGHRAVRGPRWTYRHLRAVLTLTFGSSGRGRPDTAAVAQAAGVHRSTVRRWLRGKDRALARLPAGRLELLQSLTRPTSSVLQQEELGAQYARQAMHVLASAPSKALGSWSARRWLEPHQVLVLDVPGLGVRQVTITRGSARSRQDLARRGVVLEQRTVPTRFEATVLAHRLLTVLDAWRVLTPPGALPAGATQTWMRQAPKVRLSELKLTAPEVPGAKERAADPTTVT